MEKTRSGEPFFWSSRKSCEPVFPKRGASKQFLEYVVKHQLEGHPELLKERTIGTEVFLRQRYATGDDPVVRVQAGEVRRRLGAVLSGNPTDCKVRIELPSAPIRLHSLVSDTVATELPHPQPPSLSPSPEPERNPQPFPSREAVGDCVACLVLALAAGAAFLTLHRSAQQKSVIEQFLEPGFCHPAPVLICLRSGGLQADTGNLSTLYTHPPNTFQTEVERTNHRFPEPG